MTTKTAAKARLGSEIRLRLEGFQGGQRAAAEQLELPYDILRRALSRNRFDERMLGLLCGLIDLPTEIDLLQSQFEFETITPRKTARSLNRHVKAKVKASRVAATSQPEPEVRNSLIEQMHKRVDRLNRIAENELEEDIGNVYSAFGKGDLIALVTYNTTAVEWSGNLMQRAAEFLIRGGVLAYIIPSQQLVDQAEELAAGAVPPDSVKRYRSLFEMFCKDLAAQPGLSHASVEKSVALILAGAPMFFSPQHKYALIRYHQDGKRWSWALTLVPTTVKTPRGDSTTADYGAAFLPLNASTTQGLQGFIRAAVDTALQLSGASNNDALTRVQELLRPLTQSSTPGEATRSVDS